MFRLIAKLLIPNLVIASALMLGSASSRTLHAAAESEATGSNATGRPEISTGTAPGVASGR